MGSGGEAMRSGGAGEAIYSRASRGGPPCTRSIAGGGRTTALSSSQRTAVLGVAGDGDFGSNPAGAEALEHQQRATATMAGSVGAEGGWRGLSTGGDWAAKLWPWLRETSSRLSLGSSGGGYGKWW